MNITNSIILDNLIYLVIFTALEIMLIVSFIKRPAQRNMPICLLISILIYSGITCLWENSGGKHISKYILFSMTYVISTVLLSNIRFKSGDDTKTSDKEIALSDRILLLGVLITDFYYIYLVFSSGRGISAFVHLRFSINDIFNKYQAMRTGVLSEALHLLSVASVPLVYAYFQRLIQRKRSLTAIALIALQAYLYSISIEYVSRNYLLQVCALILFIVLANGKHEYSISLKLVLILGVGLLITSPLMLRYEYIRLGVAFNSEGFRNDLLRLFSKELDYGKYYDYCIMISNPKLIGSFFRWIVTLPLPRFVSFGLKDNILFANKYFSESLLGVSSGQSGYYVILPSVLGEALLIYGPSYYWLHAVMLSLITTVISKALDRYSDLKLLNLYYAVMSFTVGRAGIYGLLGDMINGLFFFWMIICVIELQQYTRKRVGERRMGYYENISGSGASLTRQ